MPEPGQIFAEKYKLHEVLGEGGFAVVFRATQIDIGREVAIKLLKGASADHTARFIREARMLSHLKNPHTVTLYDFGRTEDGMAYIVCEYINGETLEDQLARGALPPEQVLQVVERILESLDEAHAGGILHRDIKPGNLMLEAGDTTRVKVVDFGIAKSFANPEAMIVTEEGSAIGTPRYMAPEQLAGEDTLGPTADLYSLGLVAYELLVGRPAFDIDSRIELYKAQLSEESRRLPQELDVPTALRQFVDRCLRKSPGSRPQNVAEARSILDAAYARPPGPSRGPLVATLAVAGLAVPVLVAGLFAVSTLRDSETRATAARVEPTDVDGRTSGAELDVGVPVPAADFTLIPGGLSVLGGGITKAIVADPQIAEVKEHDGIMSVTGVRVGRTELTLERGDEAAAYSVDVLTYDDPRVPPAYENLSLFEGSSLEFDYTGVERLMIAETRLLDAQVRNEDRVLVLTGREPGTTGLSLIMDGSVKTYVLTVVERPNQPRAPRDAGTD